MLASVLVPRVAPGRQEGTRVGLLAAAVAAPATVSGEPVVRIGHWETGKAGCQALTREPGDLPARSPNRWAEGPHGAAVRSGDNHNRCEGQMISLVIRRKKS